LFCGYDGKIGKERDLLAFQDILSIAILTESLQRDLFIDSVVDRGSSLKET